ncbi:hypothetical protein [Bradyrhizobium algeriense]|uniref:hypothetical protein n=1 Tax=Bradyrhizobium algeriense TaxID=634784 RepID=UPI0011AE54B0|nr:hypothetical protein [Bradyrhizobium algeriense]
MILNPDLINLYHLTHGIPIVHHRSVILEEAVNPESAKAFVRTLSRRRRRHLHPGCHFLSFSDSEYASVSPTVAVDPAIELVPVV